MTTKRDRAAAAAFFNDQPQWDLTIAHWIETGEKRYGTGTVRPNVLVLADAFAAHAAGEVEEVGIQIVALQARLRLADALALQHSGIEKLNKDTCEGKVVEIDGKKYKLTAV